MMDRAKTVAWWIGAEVWQVFFGAFTSLQLGAPGVGDRASWVPNLFVAEAFTILPVAFLLCLWGAPIGRTIATLGAAVMIALAVVGATVLSRSPADFLQFFVMLAPPWLVLLASIRRSGRASDAVAGR
jgi:hypothetical protein